MPLVHLPPTATAEEVHDVLRRDGALVVDDLADPALIDAIRVEMEPHVAATPGGSDDFAGLTTKRTGALVARSPSSRELVSHPMILDVSERLLDRAKHLQLHLTQLISIGPDSRG